MTQPKPKPVGTSLEVPVGARVRPPGAETDLVIVGGIYVLDRPGVHVVDGKEVTASDDDTETAGS